MTYAPPQPRMFMSRAEHAAWVDGMAKESRERRYRHDRREDRVTMEDYRSTLAFLAALWTEDAPDTRYFMGRLVADYAPATYVYAWYSRLTCGCTCRADCGCVRPAMRLGA